MPAKHPEHSTDTSTYVVDVIGTTPSSIDRNYSHWSEEDMSFRITRENLTAFMIWTFFFARNDLSRHWFILKKVRERNGFDSKKTFSSVTSIEEVMNIFTPEELDFFVETFNSIRHHPRDMGREDAGRLIFQQFIKTTKGSYTG